MDPPPKPRPPPPPGRPQSSTEKLGTDVTRSGTKATDVLKAPPSPATPPPPSSLGLPEPTDRPWEQRAAKPQQQQRNCDTTGVVDLLQIVFTCQGPAPLDTARPVPRRAQDSDYGVIVEDEKEEEEENKSASDSSSSSTSGGGSYLAAAAARLQSRGGPSMSLGRVTDLAKSTVWS